MSVISYQLSVISYQLSVIGSQESGVSYQESGVRRREIIFIYSPHTPHPTPGPLKIDKTPHPTPHTPHPAPRKSFLPQTICIKCA
ncbi:hypothetical protein [Microcystis sp. M39BS1]|uniref:hypothetical protein n=2 Tax=unclassified Microcystis TaxID=2643300 RepID=UPI002590BF85|nr:hypothetical protein [Microcystis sp. M39BS1]